MTAKPMLVPATGPHRSGTDDDAAARLPGDSTGADLDIATARRRGLPAHHEVADIPRRTPQETA
ncbi:hypothetical protein ACFXPI_30735 [Streptomyces sp. NPDC059104]|uniref:hypothetical protein n=1 Tax=Streptomyces sp. NPDC059104 TaxID=3346729 RepID=UPI003680F0D4